MIFLKKPLIILTGPTAVGQDEAVDFACPSGEWGHYLRGFHAGLPPYGYRICQNRPEEMCGVPHYLIDVLDPSEEFHVVKFVELAHEAMEKIYAAGQIPIVTGGHRPFISRRF